MAFNVIGFAIASSLTQNLEDRQRASQLTVLGGVLGNSPIGLVLIASAAQQGGGGGGTDPAQGPPTRVVIPRVAEDDLESAKRILIGRGLVPTVISVTGDRPIDELLGTDPPAGTIVSLGSTVAIEVSAGLIVPDAQGKTRQDGEGLVTEAGFVPVVKEALEPGAKGLVLKQEPIGGSFRSGGSEVVLFVVGPVAGGGGKAPAGKLTSAHGTV